MFPTQRMANVGTVTAARFRDVRAFANRRTHEVKVVHLRTEYRENPLGLDTMQPRLSWQLLSAARSTAETTPCVSRRPAGLRMTYDPADT